MKISALLLAGGKGMRMGSACPKQFLHLQNKALALYSLEVLLQLEEVKEVIVVCPPEFRYLFEGLPVRFALPGLQRQDSVYNGLSEVDSDSEWIMTHDAARPFITPVLVRSLFDAAEQSGASSLAVPAKNTLKQVGPEREVVRTLERSSIWEIQTPQLVKKQILQEGFSHAHKHALAVTDDVSLAELVGATVRLVHGSYNNVKLTTPEDLFFAEWLVQKS